MFFNVKFNNHKHLKLNLTLNQILIFMKMSI